MFATITVALIAGAIADRVKFGMWMVFAGIWATLVYFPVAHWVWGAGGWIFEGLGPLRGTPAIDFAQAGPQFTSTPVLPAWRWRSCSASVWDGRRPR